MTAICCLLLKLLVRGLVDVDNIFGVGAFRHHRTLLVLIRTNLVRCSSFPPGGRRCLLLVLRGYLQLLVSAGRLMACRRRRLMLVRVCGRARCLMSAAGAPHEYAAIHLIL